MKIPRWSWLQVSGLLFLTAFLFGCGMAGSSGSNGSGISIANSSLPEATVSQTYSTTLQATGGTGPYSWSVTGGLLPTGLTLSTSGQIAGTPTTAGDFTFTATVQDFHMSTSSGKFQIKITGAPPTISGISPNSGSTNGGTSVTISGKNLQAGAAVAFGGVAGTSVNVASSTQMTAVTPAHAAGSVEVVVTNPNGKSATLSAGFGYGGAAPTVSGISPNSGSSSGGASVTITGNNFLAGALVFLGTVAASGVAVTGPTQIQAVTPKVSTAAAVNVMVQNPDGQSGTLPNGFTYTDSPPSSSPTVTDVSPGTATAGTAVTVDGTNFGSGASVNVGSTAASNVQFLSSTQLSATVPSISPGTYDVTVANTNGLSATLSSGLTVADPTSLLSGCTVSSSDSVNWGSGGCPSGVPSGWTLAQSEGFEGGKVADPAKETVGGSVECTMAHTGSCAEVGTYTANGDDVYFDINQGVVTSSEVYFSWWEYDQSQGRLNDETYIARPFINTSSGFQEVIFDIICGDTGAPNYGFNMTACPLDLEPQTNISGGAEKSYWTSKPIGPTWGNWDQWEVHFKDNTPGNSDGEYELYKNGQLLDSATGISVSGTVDMAGMDVRIGGVYTKLTWWHDPPADTVCGTYVGDGYGLSAPLQFNSLKCPNQGPPNGVVPAYSRYFDDIIVLEK